jgi:serine/threonine protein kinase
MTNGGDCLETWMEKLKLKSNRVGFMIEMLKQILPGLAKLHSLGYSHGDLKPENICARTSHEENFKFTLIDFGMC